MSRKGQKKSPFLFLHYQCSTGKLHVVDEMCVMAFSEDLAYWGIDEIYLETCCQNKFNLRKEYIEEEIKKELLNIKQEEPDIFPETKCGNYMRFIWDLMEKSETSFAARIVSFLSMYCMSSRILTIITFYFHKTLTRFRSWWSYFLWHPCLINGTIEIVWGARYDFFSNKYL